MRDLDWAAEAAVRAMEKLDKTPLYDRIVSAIMGAFAAERAPQANEKEIDMADEKKLDELSATVKTLSDGFEKIGETIANAVAEAVKPLTDNMAEMQANQKAKDDAELAELQAKIVKANLLDEDAAKELTLNAARKLAEKAKPGTAAPVAGGGFNNSAEDEWTGYDLNAGIDGTKKDAA